MPKYAELGDRVRDRVTGYTGVVTGYTRHLTGCDRVTIQPQLGTDGKLPDAYSFDITTVEVLEAGFVKPVEVEKTPPPAPKPAAGGPIAREAARR